MLRYFKVDSDPLIVVKTDSNLKIKQKHPKRKPQTTTTNCFLTQSIYMKSFKILPLPTAMCHMSNLDQGLSWLLETSWDSPYLFLCAAVVRMQ